MVNEIVFFRQSAKCGEWSVEYCSASCEADFARIQVLKLNHSVKFSQIRLHTPLSKLHTEDRLSLRLFFFIISGMR